MGVDEHAHLVGIAPHLEAVDEDNGAVSIHTSDHSLLLRFIDYFAYIHVDHAHLREIGVYLEHPNPEADYPAPAVWYFTHDRPSDVGSISAYELSDEVVRDLLQTRQDFEKDDTRLCSELRSSLTEKARRTVRRNLHRLSVHLTIWRHNQRTERRDLAQTLLAAGRSIAEVGRALVARARREEEDSGQQERLSQYYRYKRSYGDMLALRT
ncbi:unnamed protein product [Peniophora sp. CBMAI 1063]|nr:unnamed protein product [Peniophora sp. CBMAI 1063]